MGYIQSVNLQLLTHVAQESQTSISSLCRVDFVEVFMKFTYNSNTATSTIQNRYLSSHSVLSKSVFKLLTQQSQRKCLIKMCSKMRFVI